jgi:serine/threonine-protein kinase
VPSEFEDAVDLSGQTVGEYKLIRRIGNGGMGFVYEGVQPLIGKRVAVKVLRPQLVHDGELVARFLAEARAVNAIRHRGIVDIFSFGQIEGSHYFVMEYLDGQPFDEIITSRAPLPHEDVLEWTEEVLDALDAAHNARVIHRDIKPSNLFLVNAGRGRPYVKLLDFGIAKLAERGSVPKTRETEVLGTPEYMAPEQARGEEIIPQTDFYALGCVLFEMLTSRCVFEGQSSTETMLMHLKNEAPPPSRYADRIPAEVDELVAWALKKSADERPSSAIEMRQVVTALKRKYPVERTEATLPPRTGSGSGKSSAHKPQRRPAPPIEVVPTVMHGKGLTRGPPPEGESTRLERPGTRSTPAPAKPEIQARTFDELPAAQPVGVGRKPTGEALQQQEPTQIRAPGVPLVTQPATSGPFMTPIPAERSVPRGGDIADTIPPGEKTAIGGPEKSDSFPPMDRTVMAPIPQEPPTAPPPPAADRARATRNQPPAGPSPFEKADETKLARGGSRSFPRHDATVPAEPVLVVPPDGETRPIRGTRNTPRHEPGAPTDPVPAAPVEKPMRTPRPVPLRLEAVTTDPVPLPPVSLSTDVTPPRRNSGLWISLAIAALVFIAGVSVLFVMRARAKAAQAVAPENPPAEHR